MQVTLRLWKARVMSSSPKDKSKLQISAFGLFRLTFNLDREVKIGIDYM